MQRQYEVSLNGVTLGVYRCSTPLAALELAWERYQDDRDGKHGGDFRRYPPPKAISVRPL